MFHKAICIDGSKSNALLKCSETILIEQRESFNSVAVPNRTSCFHICNL